jgi:pimeloyl-ACP methyl ester carboxylesterase
VRRLFPVPVLAFLIVLGATASPVAAEDVVFIANGSGDFRTVSDSLSCAVAAEGVPLRLETFVWSHGFGCYLSDHADHVNQVAQGRRLAGLVAEWRRACPDRAVYLVGHSAGCAVVLAAAEVLPPGSVERILLLAPSVSAGYDLRPALVCARGGIDTFYSRRDLVMLGAGVTLAGTADRRWEPAAGRVGFQPVLVGPGDAALYGKLRQHPWDGCVAWTGNLGMHYGSNREEFARAYLLPLLTRGPCTPPRLDLLPPERGNAR